MVFDFAESKRRTVEELFKGTSAFIPISNWELTQWQGYWNARNQEAESAQQKRDLGKK